MLQYLFDDWVLVDKLNQDALIFTDINDRLQLFLYKRTSKEMLETVLPLSDCFGFIKDDHYYIIAAFIDGTDYVASLNYRDIITTINENQMVSIFDYSYKELQDKFPNITETLYHDYYQFAKSQLSKNIINPER